MAQPKHEVKIQVEEIPTPVIETAKRRAINANDPNNVEQYLLDHLRFVLETPTGESPLDATLRC